MRTSASSGAPISPAARKRSSSPATCVRKPINASQSMPSTGIAGKRCQVAWNTEASRAPGRNPQISSAVNERMGASQRVIASATCHWAVCAERRAKDLSGVV